MSENDNENDLEAQLSRVLDTVVGHKVREVRIDGDALEIICARDAARTEHVRVEVKAPWRLVESGSILIGSKDAEQAGVHRQKVAEISKRCQVLVGRTVTGVEMLDFEISFGSDLSVEHFACATGDEDHDYFIEIDDNEISKSTFKLGNGWIAK